MNVEQDHKNNINLMMDIPHLEKEDLLVCQQLVEVGSLGQGGEPGLGVDRVIIIIHSL